MILTLDLETYSSEDLKKAGVHRYCASPDFEILLIAYRIDRGPTRVVDMTDVYADPGEYLALVDMIKDAGIIKRSHNAAFERTALANWLWVYMPPEQWRCTMVHAAHLGLPLSLDMASKALNVAQKDPAGKALIKYFTQPCKPTKVNGGRTRNLPHHDPEKWERFKNYCISDVLSECAIDDKIEFYQVPDQEQKLWELDQRINDRGVQVDMALVRGALAIDDQYSAALTEKVKDWTGIANPNSGAQLMGWLVSQGAYLPDLTKDSVSNTLKGHPWGAEVTRVLEARQELAKTSVKKYAAIASSVMSDGRVRGLHQFYAANRTGRWGGRRVQVQNLRRNKIKTLDMARDIVLEQDTDQLDMIYPSVPDVLSQLIRTAFVARPGSVLVPVDFSAIEARVIAWLAGEQWRLDVFNTHGKIYEASAAQMFKLTLEEITDDIRQRGKVSELALGFGGSVDALIEMGALDMGVDVTELPGLVKAWRLASPAIVRMWKNLERAAVQAIETGSALACRGLLKLTYKRGILQIELPGGRKLNYLQATLVQGNYGPQISYMGIDGISGQWARQRTYGGKLTENVVQAIARDLLGEAMLRIDKAGYSIVMHVHDEAVIEGQPGDLEPLLEIMRVQPAWAKGLPLNAAGFTTHYYKK